MRNSEIESPDNQSNRKSLLTEESFNQLSKFQTEIFKEIEMTPSFRKIINALITEENLKALSCQFLKAHICEQQSIVD